MYVQASIKRMGDEQKRRLRRLLQWRWWKRREKENQTDRKQEKSDCLCTQHYTLLFYYSVRNESKQIEIQFSKKMGQLIISLLCFKTLGKCAQHGQNVKCAVTVFLLYIMPQNLPTIATTKKPTTTRLPFSFFIVCAHLTHPPVKFRLMMKAEEWTNELLYGI